jgi:ankyrin repeat protein
VGTVPRDDLLKGPVVINALTEEELAFLRSMFDLARGGATEQLAAAVDAGIPVNLTNESGDTLLILAAYHDHPDTVRALLDRGADTARVNDRGQTALGAAVFRRSERAVLDLLAEGADPALGERSALDIARFFDLPEMLALLEGAAR